MDTDSANALGGLQGSAPLYWILTFGSQGSWLQVTVNANTGVAMSNARIKTDFLILTSLLFSSSVQYTGFRTLCRPGFFGSSVL
jgi:hypothetical protein